MSSARNLTTNLRNAILPTFGYISSEDISKYLPYWKSRETHLQQSGSDQNSINKEFKDFIELFIISYGMDIMRKNNNSSIHASEAETIQNNAFNIYAEQGPKASLAVLNTFMKSNAGEQFNKKTKAVWINNNIPGTVVINKLNAIFPLEEKTAENSDNTTESTNASTPSTPRSDISEDAESPKVSTENSPHKAGKVSPAESVLNLEIAVSTTISALTKGSANKQKISASYLGSDIEGLHDVLAELGGQILNFGREVVSDSNELSAKLYNL
jgi:hypothetical protein